MSAKKNLRGKKSGYVAGQEISAFLDVTLVNGWFASLIFFSLWKLSLLLCKKGLTNVHMGADITVALTVSMVFWSTDHCFLAWTLLRAEPVSLKFIIHVYICTAYHPRRAQYIIKT
jgi:hypothetical protein